MENEIIDGAIGEVATNPLKAAAIGMGIFVGGAATGWIANSIRHSRKEKAQAARLELKEKAKSSEANAQEGEKK